jgi:hypothetical protein
MGYSGLNTRNKKEIEPKMKTTICLYGKGNEIGSQCAFYI